MRALFTTQPGDGHIRPVTPLALALQDRGHQVRVATAASFAPVVRGLGLNPVPAGLDWVESEAETTFPGFTAARADALPTFAGRCAGPMAQDIALLAVHWRPDVIVREHLEWGGWVAAEELGVPSIRFNLGRHIPREVVLQRAGEALAELRKERGLPVDVGLRSLDGTVCFDTSPPSLAEPSSAAVNMVSIRPAVQLGLGLPLPDWCVVPAGPGPLVDLDILTPAMIRVNVLRLLTEPSFRARAREVQAEIAAMPGPGYAAEVVESAVSALATTDGARRRSTTAS